MTGIIMVGTMTGIIMAGTIMTGIMNRAGKTTITTAIASLATGRVMPMAIGAVPSHRMAKAW
jgi:hypothetical protein